MPSIISDPKRKKLFGVAAIVIAMAAQTSPAIAAPPQDPEIVAAFEEGRHLMGKGDYLGAIVQFEKILAKQRAVGALLNLAECHAKLGHTATAWATYREASAAAAESKDAERKAVADQFAATLEPKLSYLNIRVAAEPDGLTVRRDGVAVTREQRTHTPIDPGTHKVEATAPGREPWSKTFDVSGAETNVDIPELASTAPAAGPSAPIAPRPTEGDDPGSTQRTIALVVGGIGVAGLALGTVAGIVAMSNHDDAKSKCTSYPDHCAFDGSAVDPNDSARTWATISTIGFGVGAAGVLAGAALWFTAPRPSPRALRVVPSASPHAFGLGVGGAF